MILVLEKAFDRVEQQRNTMLDSVKGLSHEQLNFKSDAKTWCILEVFEHLMTAEKNGLTYMHKKLQGDIDKIGGTDMKAKLRSMVLKTALRMPVKFKAPAAARFKAKDEYHYDQVRAEWDEIREGWKELADGFDKPASEKLIFKHPLAGRLNMEQTFQFLYEHTDHHLAQLKRIQAHPNFPKA